MTDHDITLYYFNLSGPARSVIYLLDFHKNTSVKRQVTDLTKGEHLSPEFLNLNPHHTVPTLEDKTAGLVLYESTAIYQYLCEVFGWEGRYGLPKDLTKKYRVINELHKHAGFLGDLCGPKISYQLSLAAFRGAPFSIENFKKEVDGAKATLTLFDQKLEKNGGFVAGDEPTIADLRPWVDLFQLSTYGGEFTGGVLDLEEYKNITKFLLAIRKDLFDEAKWTPMAGFYAFLTQKLGTDDFRIAKKAAEAKND